MTPVTAFYLTNNHISPVMALYDVDSWPPRSAARRSCLAGTFLGARESTAEEVRITQREPRHMAYRWPSIGAMLLAERRNDREFVRELIRRARQDDRWLTWAKKVKRRQPK